MGSCLAERLVGAGHSVWGLRRRDAKLPPGVELQRADLCAPESLQALPRVDCVFYAAAADRGDETAYRAAYVDGLRNLLGALEPTFPSVQRFFFTSSTAVYAQDGGEWIDEASPTQPKRFNGQYVLEGEELLRASSLPATVVRFGGIYGPGRTGLLESVRRGSARVSAEPIYTNRIHRDDCAAALHHLMDLPEVEPTYLAVDSDPALRSDVLRWLADRLGVAEPSPAQSSDARRRGGSKRCSNARLRSTGYGFRYPSFREGYEGLL